MLVIAAIMIGSYLLILDSRAVVELGMRLVGAVMAVCPAQVCGA